MRLPEATLPRLYKRYEGQLFFRQANDDDGRRIMAEIQAGVFATDRISLDPRFTPAQAANRYQHWIEDELNRGSKAYITTFKSEDIGFSILRNDGDGRFNGLFGGLYLEKKKRRSVLRSDGPTSRRPKNLAERRSRPTWRQTIWRRSR